MDDFDFIEDDDLDNVDDISFDDFDFISNDIDDIDDSDDQCDEILDNEFIDSHFNIVPSTVIENFPFVEDDVDAITDYELFSKGFGYLDENKVNKDELSNVAYTGDYNDLSNKPDIPDVTEYVKKDTTELENYPLTSSLSSVAFSGDYDDLSDKPTIPIVPTNVSAFTNDAGYITKDVNDLTNYTLTSNLSSVATSGNYNDLTNKPTIPTVPTNVSAFTNDSGYITKNVNDLTYYTKTSDLPSVPTKTSDLTNDSGYITNSVNNLTNYPLTSSLSSVAFSGDYDDLSDKPTIPSVGNSKSWYGTSSTAAATQTKVVTCSGFTLETGASIIVKFTNKQSYNGQPKLNVNSTGAINIQYKGGTSGIRYMWNDGSTLQFVYDGTNWISEGRDIANTTYYGVTKLNDTTTSTSVNMAATANAVRVTYDYAATKQDAITSDNKLDYSLLSNTPTIPDSTSDLTNDSGFITNTVNDLTNYTTTTALTTLLADKENKSTIGSNYIKFDNGLLICWDSVATSTAITESFGGFYRSGDLTPFSNFPVTFISVPTMTVSVQATSGYSCWYLKGYPPSITNANNLRVYGTWSTTTSITFSYIAIGKWK